MTYLVGIYSPTHGAGKDTVADVLVEEFGFTKICFADGVRAAAEAIDPIIGFKGPVPLHYVDLLKVYGYRALKDHERHGPRVRRMLDRIGTRMGRDLFGSDFWIEWASLKVREVTRNGGRVVIPDVRFPEEFDAVTLSWRGEMWRVERPGLPAPNPDLASEGLLEPGRMVADWGRSLHAEDWHQTIRNDGDIEALQFKVRLIAEGFA